MKIALANVPGVKVELIEPVADVAGYYTSGLNGKSNFTVALHHVCQKLDGQLSNWDARFADLKGRAIICHADVGEAVRLIFSDDRAILGVYVEHLWMTPDAWREVEQPVPFHLRSC